MIQKEIDQCVAGLSGLIPDLAKRQKSCECTADAMQEDRIYRGERNAAYEDSYAKKVQNCGGPNKFVGSSESDPFGILKDGDGGQGADAHESGDAKDNNELEENEMMDPARDESDTPNP